MRFSEEIKAKDKTIDILLQIIENIISGELPHEDTEQLELELDRAFGVKNESRNEESFDWFGRSK